MDLYFIGNEFIFNADWEKSRGVISVKRFDWIWFIDFHRRLGDLRMDLAGVPLLVFFEVY